MWKNCAGCAILSLVGLAACEVDSPQPDPIQAASSIRAPALAEASGITRIGEHLLVVDDEVASGYFQIPVANATIGRAEPATFVPFSSGVLIPDMESIGVLGDGRIAVLSERFRALITAGAIVVEYDDPFSELGGKGLEGLAVQGLPDSSSVVAVAWEGGYLRGVDLPLPLDELLDGAVVDAIVLIHHVKPHAKGSSSDAGDPRIVTLELPRLSGNATRANTFRVADLVWHRTEQEPDSWEFILLLNSFEALWLQRYNAVTGASVGEPIDLGSVASIEAGVRRSEPNWEGLDWFDQGRSLVLVDDVGANRDGSEPPHLAVVEIPQPWRR